MAAAVLRFGRILNDVKSISRFVRYATKSNSKALNRYSCRWLSTINCLRRVDVGSATCTSSAGTKVWFQDKLVKNVRYMSNPKRKEDRSVLGELMEAKEQPQSQLTVGAKVVQAGKDFTYLGIVVVGFVVTGGLLWYVFSELFLGFSPNKVYSYALKQVLANREVVEELGEPIMGHGETTRRGRRRHVSFQEYIVDGENYMRVKFYVSGQKRKGSVHVDVKQGPRGNIIYRYIFVELTDYPQQTIIIVDNR